MKRKTELSERQMAKIALYHPELLKNANIWAKTRGTEALKISKETSSILRDIGIDVPCPMSMILQEPIATIRAIELVLKRKNQTPEN